MIYPIRTAIDIPYDEIQSFCERWQIVEFALFGSLVSNEFHDDSDVDVLVSFADSAQITLFHMIEMSDELEALFGRKVDVITRRSVERSDNYVRRQHILHSAQVIYAT